MLTLFFSIFQMNAKFGVKMFDISDYLFTSYMAVCYCFIFSVV